LGIRTGAFLKKFQGDSLALKNVGARRAGNAQAGVEGADRSQRLEPRIPLSPSGFWRDDRAAEGARLEVVCTRKGTEGSNPSLSVLAI
jgi:hypothetical protein